MIADALRFETKSLPSAFLGRDYATTLEASGGLGSYSWRLVREAPAWLLLDESTGTLSAGAYDLVTGSYELSVVLRDQANGGDGHATEKTFSLRVDNCQNDLPCWTAEGITCMVGVQACVDGVLQRCVAFDPPVFPEDLNRCGSDCRGCDETFANLCVDGRCRCGANEPCGVGNVCCGETTEALCLDSTNLAHCGACDNHCLMRVLNADDVVCTNEQCDYGLCHDGWYDCDDDRSNGCEQEQSPEDCAGCDNNCLTLPNVQSATCDTESNRCVLECVAEWADCDPDSPGCETSLSSLQNCGGCGIVCAGPLCDEGADGFFCGCDQTLNLGLESNFNQDGNPDCYADEICCSNDDGRGACIPHSTAHCLDCEETCGPNHGGPYCDENDVLVMWFCSCRGDDENCKNYVFSEAVCKTLTDQCRCGTQSDGCEPPEACCPTDNDGNAECTDLSSDWENCGICGAQCVLQDYCINGACRCHIGDCPSQSGILTCVNNICVCEEYDLKPCPISMYCRANGCCLDAFDGDCCGDGDVWCSDGSCRQPQDCP